MYFFGILVQIGIVVSRVCVQLFGKRYGGFLQWTAAYAGVAGGFIAFALRRPEHPSFGLMLAIGLFMTVAPLHLDGLIDFVRPEAKRFRRIIQCIAAIAILTFEGAYLAGIREPLLLVVFFGSIDFFNAIILYVSLRNIRQGGLSALWLIVGCVSLSLLQHIVRVTLLVTSDGHAPMFSTDQALAWACIGATLQQLLTAIAQFALSAQRVRADLEAAQRELEKLAWTDSLTGLRNRRRFIEDGRALMDSARRHNRPLALLMGDLDYFKAINDSFGHAVGDHVLRKVGHAIDDMARLSDCAGRIGGEEFAILLPETDLAAAGHVAERFRCGIEAIIPPRPGPEQITMSIGIAILQADDAALELLMDRADQALYRAKAAGRNCCMTLETSCRNYSDLRLS